MEFDEIWKKIYERDRDDSESCWSIVKKLQENGQL